MQTISTLLNELKENQILYFRIDPEDYEAFYEECRKAGVAAFYTGRSFTRQDVRSLMSIDGNHTVGYVSGLCFFGSIGRENTVNLDDNPVSIIHIDYGKLHRGEDYMIRVEHAPMINSQPLQGKVLVIENGKNE